MMLKEQSKKFLLRDYQKKALSVLDKDLKTSSEPVLFVAIMGAGKTVMAARLINKYYFDSNKKFLIMMHKKELVEQFYKTFVKFTGVATSNIGICCAGLNQKQIGRRITIATVQSFVGCVDDYSGCDLLIIDEVHRVLMNSDSQYSIVINALRSKNKYFRLLGITATPFRLDHGFIYGDKCVDGGVNLFDKINHRIKYKHLRSRIWTAFPPLIAWLVGGLVMETLMIFKVQIMDSL